MVAAFSQRIFVADDHGDPAELLTSLNEAEAKVAALREQLKAIWQEALLR